MRNLEYMPPVGQTDPNAEANSNQHHFASHTRSARYCVDLGQHHAEAAATCLSGCVSFRLHGVQVGMSTITLLDTDWLEFPLRTEEVMQMTHPHTTLLEETYSSACVSTSDTAPTQPRLLKGATLDLSELSIFPLHTTLYDVSISCLPLVTLLQAAYSVF